MPLVLLFMMTEGYVSHAAEDRTSYLIVACKERRAEVRPTFGHHKLFRSINNLDSGLYSLNFQVFPYVESIDI